MGEPMGPTAAERISTLEEQNELLELRVGILEDHVFKLAEIARDFTRPWATTPR